jgi:hypothetical protein
MATIEKRTSRSGAVTWRVKWRSGGRRDGAWDGETCDDFTTARAFRAFIEAAGEQRPPGYRRGCRGKRTELNANGLPAVNLGGHQPGPDALRLQSTAVLMQRLLGLAEVKLGPVRAGRSFGDVFEEYLKRLRKLGKVEPRQLTDYRRAWERHVADAVVQVLDKGDVGPLGAVDVREVTAEVVEAWVTWMGSGGGRTHVRTRRRSPTASTRSSSKTRTGTSASPPTARPMPPRPRGCLAGSSRSCAAASKASTNGD